MARAHLLAFTIVLVSGLGAAADARSADHVAAAEQIAAQCGERDLDGAAEGLRELLDDVSAELGEGSDAAISVRLTLTRVETARGNTAEAEKLSQLPEEDTSAPKTPRKLRSALRALASCGQGAKPPGPVAVEQIGPEQQLAVAQKLYVRGLYKAAIENLDEAQRGMGAKAPADLAQRLYELAALIQLNLGDARAALEAAEKAEALARQTGNVPLRITMAQVASRAGDLAAATESLDRIATEQISERDRAELAEARGELALRLGSPRSATGHLGQALAGHKKAFGDDAPSTATVLHLQGDAYRVSGDFPAALSAYQRALAVRRSALGAKHAETAATQNAIGVLRLRLGDSRGAEEAFQAALQSIEDPDDPGNIQAITMRTNRALARWNATADKSKAGPAVDEYAAAVVSLGAALGEDNPGYAKALVNLAQMESRRGKSRRASELLEKALAAQRQRLGASHPDVATTHLARGELLARSGQLSQAASDVDRAIAVLVESRGDQHPLVAKARTRRSRVATAQGDGGTARREALAASEAIDVHTRRTFGALPESQRALLAESSQDVIGALLSVEGAPPRETFVALLPHRDSVLRSVAASRAAARSGPGREMFQKLANLRRQYAAAVQGQGPDAAQRAAAVAKQIEGFESMSAAEGSSMPDLAPENTLKLACKRLPEDAVLIKFVAYDRTVRGKGGDTVPAYGALVVRKGCDVQRVELGDGADITKTADTFANAMGVGMPDELKARKRLSELLLRPLDAAVGDAKRWLVIPDGSLWGVPIGALPDPKAPKHYLLERVTVGYLTSTFELAESRVGKADRDALDDSLLIGAPDFGSSGSGPVVITKAGPCQMPPFEKLPGTAQEIDDIVALLPESKALVGGEASKGGFQQALGRKKPWLLHFATHAYFAGQGCHRSGADGLGDSGTVAPNPLLLSGIVMAGANNATRVESEGQSGILTAYEVAGLDLHSAGLVVLSACETGQGLAQRGQEVQGLRWGFRAAGARALVTSLWKSNDVSTRRMMKSFYETLVSEDLGDDPMRGAEALRRAQLSEVSDEQRLMISRPVQWANFIFSGVL